VTRPILAEVVRSGFVEGQHRGSVVALGADGSRVLSLGPVDDLILPRSANKPMQAVGLLRAGLSLDGPELAIAASSHNGEQMHVDLVRRILADAGLDETALQNTADLPLHPEAAYALIRAGGGAQAVHQNCSGKHAAMLATCVRNGWPTEGYVAASHPVQQVCLDAIADLSDQPIGALAVDGCGAALGGITLVGLARAFSRLVTALAGTPERRVTDAMRAHPELVGGTGRDVTALMSGMPGLLAKDGAEGVYAAALPDGSAVAVKIADGSARARTPVLVRAFQLLGCDTGPIAELATTPVLGHGRPVGEVRPTF
jgi:L-asparaginase II